MTDTPNDLTEPARSLDLNSLDPQGRINYIMEVRRRIQEDPKSVSDDEIRDAVRLIRLNRAEPTKRKASKSAAPAVTLSDF